jgi:hypothetical protein
MTDKPVDFIANDAVCGREINQRHPDMKILYVSGYAKDCAYLAADDNHPEFLVKGGSSREMCRRIREVLDKVKTSEEC